MDVNTRRTGYTHDRYTTFDLQFITCACACARTCALHKYIHACIAHACFHVRAYAYEMHLGSISRFSLQFVICRHELCINIRSVQIYETGRKKEISSIARLIFARLCMRGHSFIRKVYKWIHIFRRNIYKKHVYIFKFIKHLTNNL